jgi:hypothetical protein
LKASNKPQSITKIIELIFSVASIVLIQAQPVKEHGNLRKGTILSISTERGDAAGKLR